MTYYKPPVGAEVDHVTSTFTIPNGKKDSILLVDTSASRTINLPVPAEGRRIWVSDHFGTSQTFPITLSRNGGTYLIENINGNVQLSNNRGFWLLTSDGTDYFVVAYGGESDGLGIGQSLSNTNELITNISSSDFSQSTSGFGLTTNTYNLSTTADQILSLSQIDLYTSDPSEEFPLADSFLKGKILSKVNIPSPTYSRKYIIKDIANNSSTYPIQLLRLANFPIDNAYVDFELFRDGGVVHLISDGKRYWNFPVTGNIKSVSKSPYTISGTNDQALLVDTFSIPITINLPSPALNQRIAIKDAIGTASTYPVTLSRNGGTYTIEGLASNYALRQDFGYRQLVSDGTNYWLSFGIGTTQTISTNTTLSTINHATVFVNTSGGPVTVTLPENQVPGQRITIKDIGNASTNSVTIQAADSPIDNYPFQISINASFGEKTFIATGDNWIEVNGSHTIVPNPLPNNIIYAYSNTILPNVTSDILALVDTSDAKSITLPSITAQKKVIVKDASGTGAETYPITIKSTNNSKIDKDYLSYPINATRNAKTFSFDGYGWHQTWSIGTIKHVFATPYTISTSSDITLLINSESGSKTINLPTPTNNQKFVFKDIAGFATTYPITLVRSASETIEGLASNYTIYGSFNEYGMVCDGTNYYLVNNPVGTVQTITANHNVPDSNNYTYLVDTTSLAITINLPYPTANQIITIKDKAGNATNNPITVSRNGNALFIDNDPTEFQMYGNWNSVTFMSDGMDWWRI